jgi:predicted flavoprotein YhiN
VHRHSVTSCQRLKHTLAQYLPKQLVEFPQTQGQLARGDAEAADHNTEDIVGGISAKLAASAKRGAEGCRTAEVTHGSVYTKALSSNTMEANKVSNLHFLSKVVDITG